jgi:WD40 repeat protein
VAAVQELEQEMPIEHTEFGSITIDGKTYEHDVIIRLSGKVDKRQKKLSKELYGTSHIVSKAEAKSVFEDGCDLLTNAFAISPDMKKLAAGMQSGKIGIFDSDSGDLQAVLEVTASDFGLFIALSFNPSDPNMLVTSTQGGSIFVWDVENNIATKLTGTKGNAYQVAFSGDGSSIAASSDDGVVRIWKTTELTDEPITLVGHKGAVRWVAYSPDGKSLATACPTDRTIRIWNRHSPLAEEPRSRVSRGIDARGSEVLPPRDSSRSIEVLRQHDFGHIAASAESETGRLAVVSTEGRFALFDHAKGWRDPISEWQGPADVTGLTLEHDPDRIVAVSRSGKTKSWPFFRDVSALISFARDHIPFNGIGEGRLTLSTQDRCKIAPRDDSACKPKLEQVPMQFW